MSSVAMHCAFCGFRVQLCFRACELPSKCPVSGGDGAPRTTCRLFDFWKMNWHYLFGSSVSDCPIDPLSSPRSLLHNSTHGKRLAEHVVSQDGASVQGDALQAGCDGCQEASCTDGGLLVSRASALSCNPLTGQGSQTRKSSPTPKSSPQPRNTPAPKSQLKNFSYFPLKPAPKSAFKVPPKSATKVAIFSCA